MEDTTDSAAAHPVAGPAENGDEGEIDPVAPHKELPVDLGLGDMELMIASIRSGTGRVGTEQAEPVVADTEEAEAEEAEAVVGDAEEAGSGEADLVVADTEEAEAEEAEAEEAEAEEAEAVVGDAEEAASGEADPVVADTEEAAAEEAEPAPTGPDDADTVEMPQAGAVLSGGQHPVPQRPEQQVPEPAQAQNRADKKRFRVLIPIAIMLAALLIGALFFARRDAGGVTVRSNPTVTATAPTTASMPTSEPSDESTVTSTDESSIQLEGLVDSARPLQAIRIQGRYRDGADTFLRVQRWEEGKWLDFPLPTKTDQSGQFTTYVELAQPGRYRLRVMDPNSGVTSGTFVLVIKD